MKVLVDTSVWSTALRRGTTGYAGIVAALRSLVSAHRVEIIGSIRQEVLSGIREQAQFDRLQNHLSAFPDLGISTEDYVMAAKFFNLCRTRGVQGSNTDFLICAVAMHNHLAIFTMDKDFLQFVKYIPIILHTTEGFKSGKGE